MERNGLLYHATRTTDTLFRHSHSIKKMNGEEFRGVALKVIDFVAEYHETIRNRPVAPPVEPGFLRRMLPEKAPMEAETWHNLWQHFQTAILPNSKHWQSPRFHADVPFSW